MAKKRWRLPAWKALGGLFLFGGAAAMLVLFVAVAVLARDLPSVEQINNHQLKQSTRIYDRTGEVLLYEITSGEKRLVVPFEEIPQVVKDATIAIEDKDFYRGPAFSWKGILRAVFANLTSTDGRLQGGSTITQQLARNAFLTLEQTYTRKARELILALQLSRHYSKDKILWFYMNEIDYGPNISGVGTASLAYFNKPVKEVSLAEAAVLAALPQAPSYYSPWGSHQNELMARQKVVLREMLESGKISQEEHDRAAAEEVKFEPQPLTGIKAPHFVLTVQDYLIKKYGDDMVRSGGLTVKTTLDWKLQEAAEKAVKEGAERNEELYKGRNAALVAEDPRTGEIIAFVGSRDYFNKDIGGSFNVPIQGLRQPGSALKPFAYLTAFQKGFRPETVLFDLPTEFVPNNPACPLTPNFKAVNRDCFHPQNYDGDFKGPISMRHSLAQSINVTAVKTLYLAGQRNVLNTLADFGITTLSDYRRFGLSLVLGGGEVKLAELTKAYSVLAQEGMRREQAMVLEVRDANGDVLEEFKKEEQRVFDPEPIRMVNDILSDVDARSALFSGSLNLTVFGDHDVALKTGTTNDYHDAWAMGYTPSLVVGVWAGNNDNTAMQRRGGSILAAVPIWSAFMREALKDRPVETFTRPEPSVPEKPVLAGNYAVNGQVHTILYHVDRADPTGPPPGNPAADPQFENWEHGVRQWAGANPVIPPGGGSDMQIQFTSPAPGSFVQGPVNVQAVLTAPQPIQQIKIYWNGAQIEERNGNFGTSYSVTHSFTPPQTQMQNIVEVEIVSNGKAFRTGVIIFAPAEG